VGNGPGAMTRVAAGLAGPGGSATPGRVLGSGEDVRTVPSWHPLRSASDRGTVDALADVRGRIEPLSMALRRDLIMRNSPRGPQRNAVPGVYRWRASLWRHFCATTMEAAGGTTFEWPQAVSGSPQWGVAPSTVPVDDQASRCCPGASSLKQLHAALKPTWRGGEQSPLTNEREHNLRASRYCQWIPQSRPRGRRAAPRVWRRGGSCHSATQERPVLIT
jgi:hypothetical protein